MMAAAGAASDVHILALLGLSIGSVRFVQRLTRYIVRPQETWLTGIHFMGILYWERWRTGSPPDVLMELAAEAAAIEGDKGLENQQREQMAGQMRDLLIQAHMPAAHIQLDLRPHAPALALSILQEAQRGDYAIVALSHHHGDLLSQVTQRASSDFLRQFVPPTTSIWEF